MNKRFATVALFMSASLLANLYTRDAKAAAAADPVLATLDQELKRSLTNLKSRGQVALYYLAYRLYDGRWFSISASDGAITHERPGNDWRMLSVDLRVGSPRFDNTHYFRGSQSSSPQNYDKSSKEGSILPYIGQDTPLKECLWLNTDDAFKQAQRRFTELRADNDVLAVEEDRSGDFSLQPAQTFQTPVQDIPFDSKIWEERVRRLSKIILNHPLIETSHVVFDARPTTRYFVNSEGTQLIEQQKSYSISASASSLANDGMNLWLWDLAEAPDPSLLPDESSMAKRLEKLAKTLDALRDAPPADAYVGPAILSPKAAAVFFHETFGHRIESVHQKNETEGKTFAKKIGKPVMPKFLSIVDDPTIARAHGLYLNGHYIYDDEGVKAQPVTLAKDGVLTGFLVGRTPVQGFSTSNGHGRSSPGWNPMARQANLFVTADKSKQVSPQMLRQKLIDEAKRQHKSYGLLFDQVAGGLTYTGSSTEQTYFVNPLVVYKIFVDGRPDQLIRGADIVGTPLAALEKIIGVSSEYGVFNGTCGRESGPVPVSAVAPGILVQSIEIKRKAKTFYKPPILSDPTTLKQATATGQNTIGQTATGQTTTRQVATEQAATGQVTAVQTATVQSTTGQITTPQSTSGRSATKQTTTGQPVVQNR